MARDLKKDIKVINTAALIVGATDMVILSTAGCAELKESMLVEGFGSIEAFSKPGYIVTGGIVDQGNESFEALIIELSDKIRGAETVKELVDIFFESMEEEVK